jgi:hypothetical protein
LLTAYFVADFLFYLLNVLSTGRTFGGHLQVDALFVEEEAWKGARREGPLGRRY